MNIPSQIKQYIADQPTAKGADLQALHTRILLLLPGCKLWFETGLNSEGKVVSNPNIGYGSYTIRYANGDTREFFQIGLSANTSGISIYIMGVKEKSALSEKFATNLGKAKVTGYCIKFKAIKDINLDVLDAAIRFGVEQSGAA